MKGCISSAMTSRVYENKGNMGSGCNGTRVGDPLCWMFDVFVVQQGNASRGGKNSRRRSITRARVLL